MEGVLLSFFSVARITGLSIATSILFFELSGISYAISRLEEFRASKLAVHQTLLGGISPLAWSEEAKKHLLDSINGNWIRLSQIDLSDIENFKAACKKDALRFYKIDDYSFGVDNTLMTNDGNSVVIKFEYIGKGGVSYAIRRDYRAYNKYMMDSMKLSEGDFALVNNARMANQEAIVLLLTPNTLMQIDFYAGFPEIFGRCE